MESPIPPKVLAHFVERLLSPYIFIHPPDLPRRAGMFPLILEVDDVKTILGFMLVFLSTALLAGETLSEREAARIADAIYIIEGGTKAKVPYGILSMKVRDKEHARRICINTIRNNHERWMKAGKKGDFLHFLADRYCPPSDSAGNRNWKRNIQLVLKSRPMLAVR